MTIKSADSASLILPTDNTLGEIQVLKQKLTELISLKAVRIEINVAAVASIDVASMQLLLALVNEIQGAQSELVWHKPSDVFCNVVELLNLGKRIQLLESK